jgi:hypothetical protein
MWLNTSDLGMEKAAGFRLPNVDGNLDLEFGTAFSISPSRAKFELQSLAAMPPVRFLPPRPATTPEFGLQPVP